MEQKSAVKKLDPKIVVVSVPNRRVGRKILRKVLEAKLAACVTILPGVKSSYWWKDKIETSSEEILLFKTSGSRLSQLQKLVQKNHPFEVPEFIAIPITDGSKSYLKWLEANLRLGD